MLFMTGIALCVAFCVAAMVFYGLMVLAFALFRAALWLVPIAVCVAIVVVLVRVMV